MLQFISFSEMNGTYAYRVELSINGNNHNWKLMLVSGSSITPMGSGVAKSTQVAFEDAVNFMLSAPKSPPFNAVSQKVQYMVSNGMLTENEIRSSLLKISFPLFLPLHFY